MPPYLTAGLWTELMHMEQWEREIRAPKYDFFLSGWSYFIGGKNMLVSRELNAGYWALRIAFGLGPLLAGLDKFTNILVNWGKYLSPVATRQLPVSAVTFMHIVGVVEIIVGLGVLFGATRIFGYIAMLWLWCIAANLISTGTNY